VWIDHREPLVAYDPRCSPPPEHSLLQLLAQAGHLTAKQAAEILGMPVRTAQHTLRKLAEDGACRAERDGRRMEYHLEDTTFMEPTGY
jgi:DNA-binding transcriptional ArsR family regulator